MSINTKENKPIKHESEELHTDEPLSEKDEVKKAEDRTAKTQKKTDGSVAADLKNREH